MRAAQAHSATSSFVKACSNSASHLASVFCPIGTRMTTSCASVTNRRISSSRTKPGPAGDLERGESVLFVQLVVVDLVAAVRAVYSGDRQSEKVVSGLLDRDGMHGPVRQRVEAQPGCVAERDQGESDERQNPGAARPVSAALRITRSREEAERGRQEGQPGDAAPRVHVQGDGGEP